MKLLLVTKLAVVLIGSHSGFSGDSWYEGKHQGGGGDGDTITATTMPPPEPPAIIHHKDEVKITLEEAQAEALKQGANITTFAFKLPEFPKAKPGSKRAAFDNFEDVLELSTGAYGEAFGGGFPGVTRAIFLGMI